MAGLVHPRLDGADEWEPANSVEYGAACFAGSWSFGVVESTALPADAVGPAGRVAAFVRQLVLNGCEIG